MVFSENNTIYFEKVRHSVLAMTLTTTFIDNGLILITFELEFFFTEVTNKLNFWHLNKIKIEINESRLIFYLNESSYH